MTTFTSVQGNILRSEREALVNTVNCTGVMGAGLALQFKQAYPQMYQAYRRECQAGLVRTGDVRPHTVPGGKIIINFPTKRHWQNPSRMEYIEEGIESLRDLIAHHGITSLAVPPLGCGRGGLDWRQVRPLITARLDLPGLEVDIHEPANNTHGRTPHPKRT